VATQPVPSLKEIWAVVAQLVAERARLPEDHRRLIRLPEVLRSAGLSRSEWYRLISLQRAPPPVPLGDRSRAWVESEVQAWIAERIAARDKATA
jgi:prophage regulatory protein